MKSSRSGKPLTFVVATGCSLTTRRAFDAAVSGASWIGARVSLLHVTKRAWPASELAAGARALKPLKTAVLLKLVRLARLASEGGIRADTHLATDNPAERILAHCRTHHVDLLVVGTQGRGGLSCTVLGSLTDELVRKEPCPLLTFNPSVECWSPVKRWGGR